MTYNKKGLVVISIAIILFAISIITFLKYLDSMKEVVEPERKETISKPSNTLTTPTSEVKPQIEYRLTVPPNNKPEQSIQIHKDEIQAVNQQNIIYNSTPMTDTNDFRENSINVPIPEEEPAQAPEPELVTTLEVINTNQGQGLGREYLARPVAFDEKNYIEIGLVVRINDEDKNDQTVTITTPDSNQDKEMTSTGNVKKMIYNGAQRVVSYYPFHYEFKTPGTHEINFFSNGVYLKLTLEAPEDTRP